MTFHELIFAVATNKTTKSVIIQTLFEFQSENYIKFNPAFRFKISNWSFLFKQELYNGMDEKNHKITKKKIVFD